MIYASSEEQRGLRRFVDEADAGLRRDVPLVPAASIAGRALVTVIAIMTFLAGLTAGTAMLIANAADGWRGEVAREMTIQVRPVTGRDLDADVAAALDAARAIPGIADVYAYSKAQSEALLTPWLGAGLDLSELPVPRLIVVKLDPRAALDVDALRKAVIDKVPNATIDDHRLWLQRLSIMAGTVVVIAFVILALVMVAMVLAVGFATRGAMAGNREIIEVLHLVGAADGYISRQFQRHFFRLGLRGGIIGGGAAILVFLLSSSISVLMRTTAGGDQLEAMFGSFALSIKGYSVIVLIAGGIAVTTGLVSRLIVFRRLRELL
ncbi:ABC transporter permease [Methylovirgula ligni]|uniref:Cell division transport system permease protein n=2 Tax=Methylovirgula ligni TaxID=569860 RepID=A0A3D9Z079_9HYPH|nr:ABC transporter permease [Methylovirgula ligni]QAY97114.1 ABC transporter permease [Methylovirgula ligni]REF87508.1 cell division transport system permease protein [Methylovirgula ligni]